MAAAGKRRQLRETVRREGALRRAPGLWRGFAAELRRPSPTGRRKQNPLAGRPGVPVCKALPVSLSTQAGPPPFRKARGTWHVRVGVEQLKPFQFPAALSSGQPPPFTGQDAAPGPGVGFPLGPLQAVLVPGGISTSAVHWLGLERPFSSLASVQGFVAGGRRRAHPCVLGGLARKNAGLSPR